MRGSPLGERSASGRKAASVSARAPADGASFCTDKAAGLRINSGNVMDIANGNIPILGQTPKLGESEQACVELLQETLDLALEGKIASVGIVVCMDGGYASVMAGSKAADLNLGVDSLKRKIIDAVEQGNVKRRSGGIMRVR